jgi:tetratricopeptide (TPR) repeat protein
MYRCSVGLGPSAAQTSVIKRVGAWTVVAISMTVSAAALGQSAADKATARQLATQGIQYYQQGKHAEALDLLQRAEQLYDAPVHLIYIARAQAALGKLVEASETYRRLIRTDLPAGAPQPFKDAVSDAQKELQQLEPKVPSLRIDVVPADAKGLQLKVDGDVISSVVIGINRPTNPGKHTVEAAAPNFDAATASVDLVVGGKQTVALQMQPRPGAPGPVPALVAGGPASGTTPAAGVEAGGGGTPAAGAGPQPVPVATASGPFDKPPHIVLGVRLLAAVPGGKIRLGGSDPNGVAINGAGNTETNLHDRFGNGVGLWLSAGYRFPIGEKLALTPALAFEGEWFDKGPYYAEKADNIIRDYYAAQQSGTSTVLQVTPTARTVLLGAMIEFPRPLHTWSPTFYGELYLIPYHQLKTTGTVTSGSSECQISDTITGSGAKLGAGVLLPATKLIRLGGGLGAMIASSSSRMYWDTCRRKGTNGTPVDGIASTSLDMSGGGKLHTIVGLNVGGDFMLGL